jgi:hypothetical protein
MRTRGLDGHTNGALPIKVGFGIVRYCGKYDDTTTAQMI